MRWCMCLHVNISIFRRLKARYCGKRATNNWLLLLLDFSVCFFFVRMFIFNTQFSFFPFLSLALSFTSRFSFYFMFLSVYREWQIKCVFCAINCMSDFCLLLSSFVFLYFSYFSSVDFFLQFTRKKVAKTIQKCYNNERARKGKKYHQCFFVVHWTFCTRYATIVNHTYTTKNPQEKVNSWYFRIGIMFMQYQLV